MCRECSSSAGGCEPPDDPDPVPAAVRLMLAVLVTAVIAYGILFARLLFLL